MMNDMRRGEKEARICPNRMINDHKGLLSLYCGDDQNFLWLFNVHVEVQPLKKHHCFLLQAFIVIFKTAKKFNQRVDESMFNGRGKNETRMKNNDLNVA